LWKLNSDKPIFLQIAEGIEDAILSGAFKEEEQIPSTNEISAEYRINPATALKGVNILVDEEILYKKRGIGMFVTKGATKIIARKRSQRFFEDYVSNLIAEAKKLDLSKEDIIAMLERGFKQ
jgi:GntR family transcriptional regulator